MRVERQKKAKAEGEYPERGQTSFQRPPSTHTPGTDTAFMSVAGEHKPTGLVSVSQCPWEQSPLAETKRGWLRCHLHHKGKPFSPKPLPVCHAMHHFYRESGPTWHLPFFFLSLPPPPFYPFSLPHTVCPPQSISTTRPPPPSLPSRSQRFSLYQPCRFLVLPVVMCLMQYATAPLATKTH